MTEGTFTEEWDGPPATVIGYDWPADGIDPFDLAPEGTLWVLYANRWGRAWPAGSFRDFGTIGGGFVERVPMGYKPILVYERLAVVEEGRVLGEWPETATPSADSSLARRCAPYAAVTQKAWRHLSGTGYPDRAAAVEAALAHTSAAPGEGAVMVARTLRHETWH